MEARLIWIATNFRRKLKLCHKHFASFHLKIQARWKKKIKKKARWTEMEVISGARWTFLLIIQVSEMEEFIFSSLPLRSLLKAICMCFRCLSLLYSFTNLSNKMSRFAFRYCRIFAKICQKVHQNMDNFTSIWRKWMCSKFRNHADKAIPKILEEMGSRVEARNCKHKFLKKDRIVRGREGKEQ